MALYDFYISNNERLLFPLISQINAELILNFKLQITQISQI